MINELSLNHNHLKSLDGIEQFEGLKKLHLNFNNLSGKEELMKVQAPEGLIEISLKGNPKLDGDWETEGYVRALFKK